ncbi:Alpha/beta hydrolase fold-1 [Xylariaceae sp. FL0016]|nr:Alpha/beta hydrolase fold-1 [Xylariaceae sp. FL0016]
MMADRKPVLVFCPGAWCTPLYFEPTISILEAAGYTCVAVSLPSVGSESRSQDSPPVSTGLQADAGAVRRTLLEQLDAGHDVVLVAHSYGGIVSSEAVRGLDAASRGAGTPAVRHLVYVAALLLDVGARVWRDGEPPDDGSYIIQGPVCWMNPEDPKAALAIARCGPEALVLLMRAVASHAWRCFAEPVTFAGWRVVGGTYVRATEDPMPDQMAGAPEGHLFGEVVEVEGDHFVFTGAAEETAAVIRRTVEKVVRAR